MTRATPKSRSEFRWFFETGTQWKDVDVYGHINNTVHYTWFDTAVNCWLIEHGLLDPLHGETIGLVVSTNCEYFAEARFLDRIACGVSVRGVGNTSVTYEVGLFRNDGDTAFAQGSFVHVYVNAKSRRPVPLSAHMAGAMQALRSAADRP